MADKNYLHTAYANSADGTEGFTTVYPNLNLLSNSLFKYPLKLTADSNSAFYGLQSNIVGSEYVPSTSNKDLTISSLYVAGLELPIGVYTSSITIANNSETVANVQYILMAGIADTGINPTVNGVDIPWETAYSNPRVTINIPPKSNKRYTLTFTAKSTNSTNGGSVPQFLIFRETTAIPVTRYSKPKLEQGSTATPHMPSASEVTTADRPKYIGFSNTIKTNKSASDYAWFPVKDSELTNKVDSHVNNKANPHAVTASQVGAYSKQEIDTKLSKAVMADDSGKVSIGTLDSNTLTVQGTKIYPNTKDGVWTVERLFDNEYRLTTVMSVSEAVAYAWNSLFISSPITHTAIPSGYIEQSFTSSMANTSSLMWCAPDTNTSFRIVSGEKSQGASRKVIVTVYATK